MNPVNRLPLAAAIALGLASPMLGFAQQESDTVTDRITVMADPLGDRGPDDLVRPVSVVTGEALERRRAATLGELLDGLPGVANSDFGPGVGRPVVRGLQGSRVQVLEDGMGTSDVSGEGADHAIGIDPAGAEQVEVFRGPATLLYGSGAAGGVVNVVTRRFAPDFADQMRVDGRFSYGFNGEDKQGRLAVEAPLSSDVVVRADYSIRRTEDFDIKGFQQIGQTAGNKDTLAVSSIDTDSASLTGLFRGDWGFLGLGMSYWDTDYGIPENFDARPRDMGGQSDDFERVVAEALRFDLRGEFFRPLPGFSTARLKMSYTDFEQEEAEFEFNRSPTGGFLDERTVEVEFNNKEWDTRLELVHNPLGNWRGVLGLQYTDRDFEADDPRGADRGFYVRPNVTRTLAGFILEELPTDFGRVELGARIERVRANPEDVFGYRVQGVTQTDGSFLAFPERLNTQSFTPFSLSAGAVFDVGTDYHVRAVATRSERAPSPEQLFAFGRHAAAGTFEVGDTTLGKEAYSNFELGFDRHSGPFRFEAAVFYNRVSDFIYLASEDDGTGNPVGVNDIGNRAGEGAAAGCEPGAGGLCRLRNQLVFSEQADAEFYGLEFNAVSQVATGRIPLDLRVSGDYVRGKLRDGGNLPRISPMRMGLGADTSFGDWSLSIDFQRVFRQTNTAVAESETGSYDLLGFDLFWRPLMFRNAQVFLQGRNLFNEDGRRHQSFFKEEAPIIGRSLVTGLRFQYGG